MAKRRAQQQQAPGAPRPEGEQADEKEPAYAAESSEIERYLESIGVKIERRGPPPPRRQPPPPPPEAEPVVLRPIEAEPYEGPGDLVAEEAPPPPPPVPRPEPWPVRVAVRHEPAPVLRPRLQPFRPETQLEPAAVESSPAAAHDSAVPSPPRPALPVLGARPGLFDLRRAVVLAEVIRRPNFERLPFERDPF